MTRPIKFRAWDGKEIVEVSDMTLYDGDSRRLNDSVESHYDKWPLMQFTGLLDKNGKEIYEGDICSLKDGLKWKINSIEENYQVREMMAANETFEVIGNIYENPDLLEV